MRCSDGHVRWGVYGAAGVVFVLTDKYIPKPKEVFYSFEARIPIAVP